MFATARACIRVVPDQEQRRLSGSVRRVRLVNCAPLLHVEAGRVQKVEHWVSLLRHPAAHLMF